MEQSHHLLGILRALVDTVDGLSSDEEVISALSKPVYQIVSTQTRFAGVLQVLLARVSAPWLERLCIDLGLSGDRLHQRSIESQPVEESGAENSIASLKFLLEGSLR